MAPSDSESSSNPLGSNGAGDADDTMDLESALKGMKDGTVSEAKVAEILRWETRMDVALHRTITSVVAQMSEAPSNWRAYNDRLNHSLSACLTVAPGA